MIKPFIYVVWKSCCSSLTIGLYKEEVNFVKFMITNMYSGKHGGPNIGNVRLITIEHFKEVQSILSCQFKSLQNNHSIIAHCLAKDKRVTLMWLKIGSISYPLTLLCCKPSMTHCTIVSADPYVKDYKNPLHLDVIDRYLRRMGDRTIPDEAPPSLESFYPPWVAGIHLPQSRCCGFFVSFTYKHK